MLITRIEASRRQLMMERLKAAAVTVDSCIKRLAEIMRSVLKSHSQTASSVIGRQHIPNMGQVLLLHRGGKRHILAFWVLHTIKEKWEVVKWAQKKLDMLGVWCPQYDPGHMPGLVTSRCWAGLGWGGDGTWEKATKTHYHPLFNVHSMLYAVYTDYWC